VTLRQAQDIVERLRACEAYATELAERLDAAKVEIERLRAALERLIISGEAAHEIGFRQTDIWNAFGRDLEDARTILAKVEEAAMWAVKAAAAGT
jgi:hypothetical protein